MNRRTLLIIRWCVFMLASGFLYARLKGKVDVGSYFVGKDPFAFALFGGLALALVVVNWGVESWKWRFLVRDLEPLPFHRALVATIAGTSIGMITPNRVGEFAGRVLFLSPAHRIAGAFATVVGSIAQFVVTVTLGMFGLMAISLTTMPGFIGPMASAWVGLCALVVAASLLLYFNPQVLRTLVMRLPLLRRWGSQAMVLDRFSARHLVRVLLLSLVRYAVFTAQFVLLLSVFADMRPLDSIVAIPVAFLLSTLVPTVMLTELGVRGSVAIAVLSSAPEMDQGVFLATTALWLMNIALPAMAGAFVLLVARIRTKSGGA